MAGMSAAPIPRLDGETYLALDRKAEWKSELHDGEMFPMEAVSVNHAAIDINVSAVLKARLAGTGCRAYGSPLRVQISKSRYVYPDFQIVCGKVDVIDGLEDTVTNPKVIIEILSPSTAGHDRGKKFQFYQQVPSLAEYVLISQDQPRVEVFTKQADEVWTLHFFDGAERTAKLESIEVELPLAELFDGVEFPA